MSEEAPSRLDKEKEAMLESKALLQPVTLDDIISELGLGTWNYIFFIITSLCYAMEVVNLYGPEFQAAPLQFVCADSEHSDIFAGTTNRSQCFKEVSEATPCSSFYYDTSVYYSTLTEEFDLVCDREWLRYFFQQTFTLGALVGSILSGILCDRFGRRPVIWYGTLAINIFTLLMVSVPWFQVILLLRFCIGVLTTIILPSAYAIGLEGIPPTSRSTYGLVVAMPYAAMVSLLSVIAYVSRRWRLIQLIGSIPMLLLICFTNPVVLNESPRWLVERGRVKEAAQIIRRATKLNKISHLETCNLEHVLTDIHQKEKLSKDADGQSEETLCDHMISMVSTMPMLKLTAITASLGTIVGAVYISLPLGSSDSKSPFIYMATMGIAELTSYCVASPIAARSSRRQIIFTCFLLTSTLELTVSALTYYEVKNDWANIVLSALAYNFVSCCYMTIVTFCSELYPTSIRSFGTSLIFLTLTIGFCVPPVLEYIFPANDAWLALALYGSTASLAAMLVLSLPETRNRPMLQTVKDYREYSPDKEKMIQQKESDSRV